MPTALISVFNKDGIEDFAQKLVDMGWSIISSGGTARVLGEAGIPVTDVAEITGQSAVLGHRVVTLAEEIHGGLLATQDQRDELENLSWPWIDLCCVDFYPLGEAVDDPNVTTESVIEKTDIGGPTMVRSAAKGRRIVVVHPDDREPVLRWIEAGQPESEKIINRLAAKAELIVGNYVLTSAEFYLDGLDPADIWS